MSDFIGFWVRRDFWRRNVTQDEFARSTRSHLIESRIEDRFVTRCGRQMRQKVRPGPYRDELAFAPQQPADACHRCKTTLPPESREPESFDMAANP